jgi:glycine cleavage system H lipoate-binding protein
MILSTIRMAGRQHHEARISDFNNNDSTTTSPQSENKDDADVGWLVSMVRGENAEEANVEHMIGRNIV